MPVKCMTLFCKLATKKTMAERRLRALLGHLRPDGGPAHVSVAASAYRYTLSGGGALSEEQRAAYERDGFLVVPGLVSLADLQTYTERFRELCCGADKTPGLTIMKDVSIAKSEFRKDEKAVTKVQNFQVIRSWPCRSSANSLAPLSAARPRAESVLLSACCPEVRRVLHWARHHGHAHNAHQQTSRPWPAVVTTPNAPR